MTNSTLAAVAAAAASAGSHPDAASGNESHAGKGAATVESLRADHGDLVQAIETSATAAGASSERERISGVLTYLGRGHDDTVVALAKDGKSTKSDAAVAILDATPAGSADVEKGLQALEKAAEGVESRPSATGDAGGVKEPKATTPDGWKAEYEASADLKEEYPTVESYVATKKREAAKAA